MEENVRLIAMNQIRSKVCLVFDNGEQFWLRQKDLIEYPYFEGQLIDMDGFRQTVRLLQYPKALDHAVSMLSRRPCSKKEIRQNLLRNHYCDDVIDLVLYKLEKEKLIDDEAFCEQWIQYRMNAKYGRNRMIQELKYKGVSPEIIQAAFDRLDSSDETEHALVLALKLWKKRKKGEPVSRSRQKVIQSLVRRGYDWDAAKEACHEAEKRI